MKKLKQKIQRNQLLIKTRKAKLERESILLNEIRNEKLSALDQLSLYQKKYIEGVDVLNKERQSTDRSRLQPLESSLDHAKSQWYKCLSKVRELEEKEKVQLKEVVEAQSSLKAMEILAENDEKNLKVHFAKLEQKNLDEIATQRAGEKVSHGIFKPARNKNTIRSKDRRDFRDHCL